MTCTPSGSICVGILLSIAVGCAADPGDGAGPVEQKTSALNGTLLFDGSCNTANRAKITSAMEIVHSQVIGDARPLTACLADAFMSSAGPGFAERITSELAGDLPTFFKCASSTDSKGFGMGIITVQGRSAEGVILDPNTITNSTVAELAGTVLHELGHDYQYGHQALNLGGDLGLDVPNQLERCSATGLPGRLGRSAIPTETELGQVGGNGGAPQEISCPDDAAVDRLVLRLSITFPQFVGQLAFNCRSQTQLGGPSPPRETVTDAVGSSLLPVIAQACDASEIAIGASGRASQVIDAIGLICAPTATVIAGGNPAPRLLPPQGGSGGTPWTRTCPAGMALHGLVARGSGGGVDRVRLECRQIATPMAFRDATMAPFGSSGGTDPRDEIHHCPGAASLVGLRGTAKDEIDRLQTDCQQVALTCSDSTHCAFGAMLPARFALPGEGGFGGTFNQGWVPVDDTCSLPGQGLVGVSFQAGARLNHIQGWCADLGPWLGTPAAPGSVVPMQGGGGSGGTPGTRLCPHGSVLAGWRITTVDVGAKAFSIPQFDDGRRVSQLSLICRAPGATPPLTQIPVAGPSVPALAVVGVVGVTINDRVKVLNAAGTTPAPIANLGNGLVSIGVNAQTGSVWSARDVFLRNNAQVFGFVDSVVGPISSQGAFLVTGPVVAGPGASFTVPPLPPTIPFPSGTFPSVTGQPNTPLPPLAPGNYDALNLPSGSSVTLRSGSYFFDSIDMEPGSQVTLDKTQGAIRIVVRSNIIHRGTFVDMGGLPGNSLVEFLGTNPVFVGTPFRGTLYAPNAAIIVNSTTLGPHIGAFWGAAVTIHQDSTLLFTPFPGAI